MTYGLFNLTTGNLIDSADTEAEALELVSDALEEPGAEADALGLVVEDEGGHTIASLHGRALTDAVYSGGITFGVFA